MMPSGMVTNGVARAKRLIKIVVGFTLLVAGIAMLVLPGQGILTIMAALAILATEYVWARRLLNRMKEKGREAVDAVRRRTG
jgi:uncharacterized protein (TIGR02611 family)